MKILDLVNSIFGSKPKIPKKLADFRFPILTHKEFALLCAERNTGIVLDAKFKYALLDTATVFTKFSNLSDAVDTATKIVKKNPNVEAGIYDKNRQMVYLSDLEKEQFHRPDMEFEFKFNKQIDQTSDAGLVNFGLDICKRLLPEYIHFYNKHKWGDPNALETAINYCESYETSKFQTQLLQDHWDRVSEVTPDMDDFGDYDGSYALNAGCAVMALLSFLIDGNKESVKEISTYITDTIDFKLLEANPNLADNEIRTHPDMIREWQYQVELLSSFHEF